MAHSESPLAHAPHTAMQLASTAWGDGRAYTREEGAYPTQWLHEHKYWPPVARVDDAWGDRNLACACAPMEDYVSEEA